MSLPKVSGMDFGNAVPIDDVLASLRDPHTHVNDMLIGIPTKATVPEYPIELALAERWDIDADQDGYPYRTFALGGLSNALIEKYNTRWREIPPIFLGRLSVEDTTEPSAIFTTIMPSVVAGHARSAATISAVYKPAEAARVKNDRPLMKLSRIFVPRSKKITENPFFRPAVINANAVGVRDGGYGHARKHGQLGTR